MTHGGSNNKLLSPKSGSIKKPADAIKLEIFGSITKYMNIHEILCC